MTEKSVLLLNRKGELYQMGEYFKDSERYFTESPRKIEKISSIKQIFSGFGCFFAHS